MITVNETTYYTTKEISNKIGVHFQTINYWIKTKKIIPFKFGPGKHYFTEEIIEKCLKGEK